MSITEFAELDPDEFHLVPKGASGFPVLLAKAVEDAVGDEQAEKAKLHAADRKELPDSDFALPDTREYPINDENHAHAALSMLHNASPEDQKRIKAAVHRRYPDIKIDGDAAEKATESHDASLVQTRATGDATGEGAGPAAGDGGEPRHVAAEDEHVDDSDGCGDTAPDKDIHRSEAESQTDSMKAEGDGTGDTAPDKDLHQASAESQTREADDDHSEASNSSGGNPPWAGKSDADTPGSPAWEDKDVALGEHAEQLASQLEQVARTFTEREKAEGAAGKAALGETEGAIRRAIEALRGLTTPQPSVSKEIDMTNDELMKLLDERDEARRQAKKAKKAAQKAAEVEAAKSVDDAEVAKSTEADELRKQLTELQARLEKVEAEPMPVPFANGAGIAAVLRDAGAADTAFKALEERVVNARTPEEAANARRQLAAAKMIAQENHRVSNPGADTGRWGPNAHPLFQNTSPAGLLGNDSAVKGI